MPPTTEAAALSDFERELLSYLDHLKSVNRNTYLSYSRSSYESPVYFHDGTSNYE